MKKCFISSTVLDLKDLRDFLDYELSKVGFEMLLSEKGTIPADSSKHSYDACIEAAKSCDILIAIVDGRYGGDVPGTGKSITQVEIETAFEAKRQVRVFVRQSVWDAKEVLRPYFKKKIAFLPTEIVKDERVFQVIDAIRKRKEGNWIFQFNSPSDILRILGTQLGFKLNEPQAPDVDRLDKIIAGNVLDVFPERLIMNLSRGFQTGRVGVDDADEFDAGCEHFYSQTLRFSDAATNAALGEFYGRAMTLNQDGPAAFGPGRNPDYYAWFGPPTSSSIPHVMEKRDEVSRLAVEMERAWRKLIDQIRARFPVLIAELLEAHGRS